MRQEPSDIVGVWEVHAPDAPFPWHMMTFTPYGTMSQTNPPAGNQSESDSGGQGVWQPNPGHQPGPATKVIGKFVEFKSSLNTGHHIGKGEISFAITVHGNQFEGHAEARTYDTKGTQIAGPFATAITGTRLQITPDN